MDDNGQPLSRFFAASRLIAEVTSEQLVFQIGLENFINFIEQTKLRESIIPDKRYIRTPFVKTLTGSKRVHNCRFINTSRHFSVFLAIHDWCFNKIYSNLIADVENFFQTLKFQQQFCKICKNRIHTKHLTSVQNVKFVKLFWDHFSIYEQFQQKFATLFEAVDHELVDQNVDDIRAVKLSQFHDIQNNQLLQWQKFETEKYSMLYTTNVCNALHDTYYASFCTCEMDLNCCETIDSINSKHLEQFYVSKIEQFHVPRINKESISYIKQIDAGGFGRCFKIRLKGVYGRYYIAKRFDSSDAFFSETRKLVQLSQCKLPGVQQLVGVCHETLEIITVYAGERLDLYLHRVCKHIKRSNLLDIFRRLCKIVHSLLQCSLTHNDIKMRNVCIVEYSHEGQFKFELTLIDFGLLTKVGDTLFEDNEYDEKDVDHYHWIHPHVLLGKVGTSENSELWSILKLIEDCEDIPFKNLKFCKK